MRTSRIERHEDDSYTFYEPWPYASVRIKEWKMKIVRWGLFLKVGDETMHRIQAARLPLLFGYSHRQLDSFTRIYAIIPLNLITRFLWWLWPNLKTGFCSYKHRTEVARLEEEIRKLRKELEKHETT